MKKMFIVALMMIFAQIALGFDGQEGHESGNGHTRRPVVQKVRTY